MAIKSKRMGRARHIARIKEISKAHNIYVRKPEVKIPLGRHRLLNKDLKTCTGFNCFRARSRVELL
jgi:hypothetical protein